MRANQNVCWAHRLDERGGDEGGKAVVAVHLLSVAVSLGVCCCLTDMYVCVCGYFPAEFVNVVKKMAVLGDDVVLSSFLLCCRARWCHKRHKEGTNNTSATPWPLIRRHCSG